jgi:glycosyltransferase involved in cell wall biosynthesis
MNNAKDTIEDKRDRQAILIVDDSSEYRTKERQTREKIGSSDDLRFYYTNYESGLIRIFHQTPALGNLLAHLLFWYRSLITALDIFFSHRMEERKLFVNPIVGLFYCALSRLAGRSERIGLAGLLFVHKNSPIYLNLRKLFTAYCCEKAALIFVYSHSELTEYSKVFPSLSSKLRFVHYGRDFGIFSARAFLSEGPYIASGGVSNRDYSTLAKTLSILDDEKCPVHCKIATRTGHAGIDFVPSNLDIRYDIRINQFGGFLQSALFVVLPLSRSQLSGGHMVLLEAMSLGKLVIVADTPGIRDYVGPTCAILYEPEDPADLARAIRFALEPHNHELLEAIAGRGKEAYWKKYTHANLMERLMSILVDREAPKIGSQ